MQFLTPIWLTALAALAVPVLIHLWNIRPGKTLKVGSIQWFEEALPANSRSLKLLDILLLIIRCLLLALVAILLAAPVWQRYRNGKQAKGWILIPEASFNFVNSQYKPQLDSLQKLGYEYHFFAPGFKTIDTTRFNQTKHSRIDTLDYWLLIKQLPQAIAASVPVHLFTPNTINHFNGDKPATPLNLTWHTFASADSVNTWLAGAWLNPGGGLRVVQGNIKPTGISYQYFNIGSDGANSPFNISVDNGKPIVVLKNNASVKIETDTAVLRISIYAGNNLTDAHYLEAALKAIEKFTQRKAQINVYRQSAALPRTGDWLFWLSEEPLKRTSARNILYYAAGKKETTSTWIENGEAQNGTKPALYQTVGLPAKAGDALWSDGFGRTILGEVVSGQCKLYPFYTRLNPAFTSLVWDERFPLWLLKLTAPPLAGPPTDTRSIAPKQILPEKITDVKKTRATPKTLVVITNYLWLALALLLFVERLLAYNKQTPTVNG